MPNGLDDFLMRQKPTAERPLQGLTVLIVEDSRYASEALRLMCLRSGARVRRADSLASAHRHLNTYRPGAIIVDVGLPDGSGLDLIRELADLPEPKPAILASSGDSALSEEAIASGAHAFLEKPIGSLGAFQSILIETLPRESRPPGPRLVQDGGVAPDTLALQDDLAQLANALRAAPDPGRLPYLAQFLRGLAQSTGDSALEEVSRTLRDIKPTASDMGDALARIAGKLEKMAGTRAIV